MTLTQRIEDIKTLASKLSRAWDQKNLFDNEKVDYAYPFSNNGDPEAVGGELNPGYTTVVVLLADLLGLSEFGTKEATKDYPRETMRNYLEYNFSQQEIWNLLKTATEFLELMESETK